MAKKEIQSERFSDNSKDDFDIVFASKADDDTVVLTSQELTDSWLREAMSTYDPSNRMYSAYLNDSQAPSALTSSRILELGQGAQSNRENILSINAIARQYVNTDDLIGMVVQSITNNINTEYRLSYKNFKDQRNKSATLKKARAIIDDFNEQVNLEQFICDSIQITYLEGNYPSLLRRDGENWQIDYLPLSVIENSGYEHNGNPVLLVDMDALKEALSKTMIKNKKGKYLFFKDVGEEIKANYPSEVYEAYKNKEKYAVLDSDYTGISRVNNFGRKYGLTPIFRALSPTLMLSNYQNADAISAKSKAKKIIHQKLRKECLGPSGDRKCFDEMAYAHKQFMNAWQNSTVVITTPPSVESIAYVEPKVEDISEEKINIYRNKVLSSLGVAFLAADKSQTASTANINLDQLLKCINRISEQVERVIEHYYDTVLQANGIDLIYRPKVTVIDSELLEMKMRIELSKLLYATFACSRDTALGIVGIDVESELAKRQQEKADNYDDIFVPYNTSFNTGGYVTDPNEPQRGRPATNEDVDKQSYDENYNETR